jgi:hypothetical protein
MANGKAFAVHSSELYGAKATAGDDGLCHLLTFDFEGSGEPPATLTLHPWNHAPRELPQVAFEALRAWWARGLRAQHGGIADALTGHRLDALQQCVAISVTGDAAAEAEAAAISDAHGLLGWLLAQHSAQLEGRTAEAPRAALLTAGPASGKTTLLSQVVTLALQDEHTELVPILVKVHVLQQRLLDAPDAFASAWNYIDAYLRLEHEASRPALYRMLRQAMMARRALLLLDGLDEAGAKRADIELHVVEVLAPQGHVLLCTSRPAGIDEARFFSNLGYYLGDFRTANPQAFTGYRLSFDAPSLAQVMFEKYVTPLRAVNALFAEFPTLTRLYTTLSPQDMTADPVFAFNASLPEVKLEHVAKAVVDCGQMHLETEQGWVVENAAVGAPPPSVSRLSGWATSSAAFRSS